MEAGVSKMFEDLMTGQDEIGTFLAGEKTGYKVSVPSDVDVKAIRKRLSMTQSRFSDTFGFSLDAVKHWEGGRRTPESSARAFLTVIAKTPRRSLPLSTLWRRAVSPGSGAVLRRRQLRRRNGR
jgi:putative transcriptional regulator